MRKVQKNCISFMLKFIAKALKTHIPVTHLDEVLETVLLELGSRKFYTLLVEVKGVETAVRPYRSNQRMRERSTSSSWGK